MKFSFWGDTPPTAREVNTWNQHGIGHDVINWWILVETRARRLGVYGKCPVCDGRGHLYTEAAAHLQLTLWMIHPRKGASRGVEIKRVDQDDLPAVRAWLRDAARRNATRFAKV